jgi:PAS domain S-box-containing protein
VKLKGIKEGMQKSQFIILIFVTLAVLMISSGALELSNSRKDLYQLMETQSNTLLESIMIASHNSLLSNEYLEELSRQRLLNNANMVRTAFEQGKVTDEWLSTTCEQNKLVQIQIYDQGGSLLFSGSGRPASSVDESIQMDDLIPIFNGEADTLILGLRRFEGGEAVFYSVALATAGRGAVALSFDATQFLEFRRNTGFGSLLNQVADENKQIRFIAFQDLDGILAATGNVTFLESIESSSFLTESLNDSIFRSRITMFDDERIFEVAHPFSYKGVTIGLIRMGLSTGSLQEINRRIFRRMIISTVVLVFVGFLVITFLFIRQRLAIVQKRYEVVETYSGSIIENVSDAIIVFDQGGLIRIYNSAAETLFGVGKEEAFARPVNSLLGQEECRVLLEPEHTFRQVRCRIAGQTKYLLLSRSSFFDSDGLEYVILVARDLTEQKQLEEQIERKQRLSAMGELASGVAHEIRNPLNAIGTIVQQLRKDFKPELNPDEYDELTGIVYKEVQRINKTIQEFLRFSRPEPVLPSSFDPGELIKELKIQYKPILDEKQISLETTVEWKGRVEWDRNQIKQVLINLLQNSFEALGNSGHIRIGLEAAENHMLVITVSDDGPGMDEKTRENLFNLYFTTKAGGTGIGLSLVQRIVYEHGGVITFESEEGKGTSFTVKLPERANS